MKMFLYVVLVNLVGRNSRVYLVSRIKYVPFLHLKRNYWVVIASLHGTRVNYVALRDNFSRLLLAGRDSSLVALMESPTLATRAP